MLRRDDASAKNTGPVGRKSGPVRRFLAWLVRPIKHMWESAGPLDAYGLVQMTSIAGDALLAIALADSIFFSIPVGQARTKVALYLLLTMAPLAFAAPLLVPLLDRGRYRRAISFAASFGRAGLAAYGASVLNSPRLFPVVFAALVLSRVHAITRTGLVAAYTDDEQGLVSANARLGRLGAVGAVLAAAVGVPVLKVGGAGAVLYLAAAVYGVAAVLTVRLARPEQQEPPADAPKKGGRPALGDGGDAAEDGGRTPGDAPDHHGRIRSLAVPALGTSGLRFAQGFLLFLFAFALRADHRPAWWMGLLLAAAIAGGLLGDVIAPFVRSRFSGGVLVFGSLVVCGLAAAYAAWRPSLANLVLLSGVAGASTEIARLAFQSLMQSRAPVGSQGRVFVRYEVVFQLTWVAGALVPAMIPLGLHGGVIVLAAVYGAIAILYVVGAGRAGSADAAGGAGSAEAASSDAAGSS